MKRLLTAFLAATMAAALLAGCTGGSTSSAAPAADSSAAPAQSSSTASAPPAEEAPPAAQAASGEAEYAVILKNLTTDFWVNMKEGIEAKAAELGVKVDVYAAQSEEDTEGQLKIFENCLTKNYKAIGIAPLSPVNVVPAVVEANKKGIYVMNIDEKIDMETLKAQGGSVVAFATTDNVKVGEKGAQYIIDQLADGGKVAIIEGKAGNASGEDRKTGATNAFTAAGEKFEIVASLPADWDRQKALDAATSLIQSNPELKGIYCCNDTMALGAMQAVINANKVGEILVVGTDGNSEAIDSVNQGMLSATVAQDSAGIGAVSLEKMIDTVKAAPAIDVAAEPEMIPVESQLITK